MKTLTVKTELYSRETIMHAIGAFCDLTNVTVCYQMDQAILTFQNCIHDAAITVREFENYMIGLENS